MTTDKTLQAKLSESVKRKLEAYSDERGFDKQTQSKQAAIVATFLQDELKAESMSPPGELYTVYTTTTGWDRRYAATSNPSAVITNGINRDKFFRGWKDTGAPP